ncbi:hypothetical protein [Sphingomonas hengshuiensis]|uniref:DUF533 domain-containing protein n=1 Tax=Sphingomonas hengshuiensis TaxID=1609977 RepID=A0A7U5BE62_9SPHN|nr:hypothetical protein [Sphingomonas hengshuiensis]AJP70645.1 hypothetical protein TS85_00550 [Sphingomonas hengshuiensis]
MIRGIVGALIGSRINRGQGGGGAKGAVMGYAAQRVIRRMGTPGLVLAGGYGLWRYASDRRKQRRNGPV